jgi:outer membrane protein assembly factor BamB
MKFPLTLMVVIFVFCIGVSFAQDEAGANIPPEVAQNQDEWALPNRDYANTRATMDSTINASNVNTLELAWSFDIAAQSIYGAAASGPLILDEVVYFQDLESNVFAIDFRTGEVIWEQMYGDAVVGPNGPGIGYGMVFVVSDTTEFAALDMNTGEEVWAVSTEGRPTGSFQPVVYGNQVYFATQAGGYTGGRSGFISAHNPQTGEIIWEFQVIQEGFWGNEALNSGGGIWYPPAIDIETGITFWGTGNPAPFAGTEEFPNGTSRTEPNLYTNSLVALTHEAGEIFWYNYVNPNDLFDLDFQSSPILATVSGQDVVIGSGKLGEIISFDRNTGEILWRTPVGIHQNDDLTEIPLGETVEVYPGILGGVETPMAYADGVVYAPVLNLPTVHSATGDGAHTGNQALNFANEQTQFGEGTSELVALDAATGEILWSHPFEMDNYGGATVVNDLVFTATFDGMIYALDRATGEEVWSYQAPGGINAWPAVVGDTIIWAAGFGDTPTLIALRLGET